MLFFGECRQMVGTQGEIKKKNQAQKDRWTVIRLLDGA